MSNEISKTTSSFWKKPEGKPGMVVLAALIGVGGFFLYKALPSIIELMQNLYTAIALGVGLFAIISIVMNSRFRTTVWYLFKGLMRFFTSLAIELNPIAILKSYVEDIREKIVQMGEQLSGLKAQMGSLNLKITKKKEECELSLDRANKLKNDKDRRAEAEMHARQAMRLKASIDKLQALLTRMEVLYKVLEKMKYYSSIMVKETEMQVEIATEEREAITKSHSVMKSAMSIIQGNSDKKIIFDEAMEVVVEDIGGKVGQMDKMLEDSMEFISCVETDDEIYAERGMKLLEKFDQDGIDAIFGKKAAEVPKAVTQGTSNYVDLSKLQTPTPMPIKKSDDESGKTGKYF